MTYTSINTQQADAKQVSGGANIYTKPLHPPPSTGGQAAFSLD